MSRDQRVRSGMSVRTKMLFDGKARRNLVDASEVFTKCHAAYEVFTSFMFRHDLD